MAYETIIQTIEETFDANWDVNVTPVRVPNVQKILGTTTRSVAELDTFVDFQIFPTQGVQAEMATNPFKRVTGFVLFGVYVKSGHGTRPAYTLIDQLKDIFELTTYNNITFRVGTVTVVGESEGFFQLSINIPFYTNTKT